MLSWRQVVDFIRLGRPLFLAGGFIFHALGLSIAHFQGIEINLAAIGWGQLAITATQWMTHYANEYFDLAADVANPTPTQWSGGSRVLAERRLPPFIAFIAAVFFAAIALIATLILGLFIQPAWGTIPLLLLTTFLAWAYSAPPLRLHSRGLGAVTVALIVPVLTPIVGYYLQAGKLNPLVFLAAAPLALLQMAMIFMINFSDAVGDREVGKRTLVVRLGNQRAVCVYLFILLLAYLLLPLWVGLGLPWQVAAAVLVPLPLALWLGWRMRKVEDKSSAEWSRLGFGSVALLMGSALLETAAFILLASG